MTPPVRRLILGLLLLGCGCNSAQRLRAWIRSEPLTGDAATPDGNTQLTVTVDPPEGITIWVDDVKVGTQSPHQQANLAAGPHTLLVRGMGYHQVVLPFTLKAAEQLVLPVSLRPRVVAEAAAPTTVSPLPQAAAGTVPPKRAPRPPPPPKPTPLPSGVEPIELQYLAQPAAPVAVDGAPSSGGRLLLTHGRGLLQAGSIHLAYSIDAERRLVFELPAGPGTGTGAVAWTQDANPLAAGASLPFSRGATRLTRTLTDGSSSSLVLRRAD